MALGLTGGLPVASSLGSGNLLSGANLSSLLAGANPVVAGISAITSLFGGSKVDVSNAGASGQAKSGQAAFFGKNNLGKNKSINLGNPLHAAIIAASVVGAVYIYKKHMR